MNKTLAALAIATMMGLPAVANAAIISANTATFTDTTAFFTFNQKFPSGSDTFNFSINSNPIGLTFSNGNKCNVTDPQDLVGTCSITKHSNTSFDAALTLTHSDMVFQGFDLNTRNATFTTRVVDTGGNETPSPVPAPAGLPLLLTGLAALGFLVKRRGS